MSAPFIPRGKPWQEKTRREIVQSLIVTTIIGGVSASIGVWKAVTHKPGDLIPVPIIFISFALFIVGTSYWQANRELKRRKRNPQGHKRS